MKLLYAIITEEIYISIVQMDNHFQLTPESLFKDHLQVQKRLPENQLRVNKAAKTMIPCNGEGDTLHGI